MTRRVLVPASPRPELDALLTKARQHKMSSEELRDQCRSWVIGQMMLIHPEMTREYVEKIYDVAIDY